MKNWWLLLLLLLPLPSDAQVLITNPDARLLVGKYTQLFVDESGKMTLDEVIRHNQFEPSTQAVPNFLYTKAAIWLRIEITNQQKVANLAIEVVNPQLDEIHFYEPGPTSYSRFISGDNFPFQQRLLIHQHFVFPIQLEKGSSAVYYLRMYSEEQLSIPIYVGTREAITASQHTGNVFTGLYLGIMFVMFFYNLFIYFSVKDRSYLYYVMYILGIALAQASLQGFTYKYAVPDWPALNKMLVVLFSTISGIGAINFARHFLHLPERLPRVNRVLLVFTGLYMLALAVFLAGFHAISYNILDVSALSVSVYALYFSIRLSLKGIRSARFFLLAWIFFMVGLVIYVARNMGLLPYTFFTDHVLMIASAVEAMLLSVALADRINTLKKEKEISQAEALRISRENEQLVREQNIVLEQKVTERTAELQQTNNELNLTLNELKNTQTQLVNAEKMASLGQLTAGIAHEINNPINFVTSNIRPLRRDINDLLETIQRFEKLIPAGDDRIKAQLDAIKSEMDFDYLTEEINVLISGMEEGAIRTAEIVKGLRTFSRLDESDLKKVNVNEGIDSTLILLNSNLGGRIEVVRDYDEDALIECYPGKLNQVFMNILNNAIQAMHANDHQSNGILTLRTKSVGEFVTIEIGDTGPGMSEEVKQRIFEPFFTTKAVGQGTGLGLSIVYSIIESHNGTIEIDSTLGVGTTFKLILPKLHK